MNDTYTGAISLSIFGESHGPAVGATLSGLAAGVPAHCARCVPITTPRFSSICFKMAHAATSGAVSRPEKWPPPRAS